MIVAATIRTVVASLLATAVLSAGSTDREHADRSDDHVQIERFLRESRILDACAKAVGEEKAYLATATDGRLTRSVFVQTIEPYRYQWFQSRADHRYNAAAYTLDRMIGAGVAPSTVVRDVNGERASVSVWTERDSGRHDGAPRAAIFRALVADPSGAFADGFGLTKELSGLRGRPVVDEDMRSALAGLTRKRLKKTLGEILTDREIRFLLARRDRILARCAVQETTVDPNAD